MNMFFVLHIYSEWNYMSEINYELSKGFELRRLSQTHTICSDLQNSRNSFMFSS